MSIRKPRLSVTETKRLAFDKLDVPQLSSQNGKNIIDLRRTNSELEDDVQIPQVEQGSLTKGQIKSRADRQPLDSTVDALSPVPTPEKVQIFLSAVPPAPGVSPIFDTLCLQYSPAKSLQMILRRAISDYETMLMNGSFHVAPTSYPITKTSNPLFVYTSRMMPSSLVSSARAHFDPLNLESKRALGLKIATAALACFFSTEPDA